MTAKPVAKRGRKPLNKTSDALTKGDAFSHVELDAAVRSWNRGSPDMLLRLIDPTETGRRCAPPYRPSPPLGRTWHTSTATPGGMPAEQHTTGSKPATT